MSSERVFEFTKDNIDVYLKEVAKEYRKMVGKQVPAEVTLIGGASALLNYGFRDMTTDVDALFVASSAMKDAINKVGDRFELPNGWLNDDFRKTASYTPKISQYSEYYRTFSNILEVRTISREYLIAMKLRSGRLYKNDRSDVVGVLLEHYLADNPITIDMVKKATTDLYDDWLAIPESSRIFIEETVEGGNYQERYKLIRSEEQETKESLLEFEKDYPGRLNERNIEDVVSTLRNKREGKKESVIEKLHQKKREAAKLNASLNKSKGRSRGDVIE